MRLLNKMRVVVFKKKGEGWSGSADYWEKRYLSGGNSGAGSYNKLSEFKAEVLNQFVKEHNINSVIEWGCGDGNQLALADYPSYVGIDIAREAIKICEIKFKMDSSKHFFWSGDKGFHLSQKADLAISLDVIYHLVEDSVFDTYMRQLFESAKRYVCIYSCNDDYILTKYKHIKHRIFTNWIEKELTETWVLDSIVKNRYPYDPSHQGTTSWSDFYFYRHR